MEKPWLTTATCRLPRRWGVVLLVGLLFITAGCSAGRTWGYLPATKAEERSVYVVGHGWHTGIVLSREELGPQLDFVTGYLREGRYYEFGWGEAEFYQAEHVTAWIFLKTVFWSNPSVMDVVSMLATPGKAFPGSDVVELTLSETGLERLKAALRGSFTFDAAGRPYPMKAGLHGESRFFKAQGSYIIFDTCNTWTARMLQTGGVPIDAAFTLRAASVMRQVKAAKKAYLPPPQPSGDLPH